MQSLVLRFEQMNSPSRVTALVWAYWRMTSDERLRFYARIAHEDGWRKPAPGSGSLAGSRGQPNGHAQEQAEPQP